MHKPLAIFLAIGIVHATVLPDTCQNLCNEPTNINLVDFIKAYKYNITEVMAALSPLEPPPPPPSPSAPVYAVRILDFLIKLESTKVTVPIVVIQNKLNALLEDKYDSYLLGPLLEKLGELFEVNVAGYIPSQIYSPYVDLKALSTYLDSVNGACSIQTLLIAIGNVVDGFFEVVASVPGTMLNVVVPMLPADIEIDSAELIAELNVLKKDGVNTMAPILIAIAKLFKVELNLQRIPSSVANTNVDLEIVITLLAKNTGRIRINAVIIGLVNGAGILMSVVNFVPGTLLFILTDLLATKNQVDVDELLAVLQGLIGLNELGPILTEICKPFRLPIGLEDIPSSLSNRVVDVSGIMRRIEGAYGLIGIDVVLALFGSAFDFLLNFSPVSY